MHSDGSVTHWIHRLKDGDSTAVQPLWKAYFGRLVSLARAKLRGAKKRDEDEEDAAVSAFHSFWRGVKEGRFPQLEGSEDLWRLLVVITARKAYDLAKREKRKKVGGGAVRGDSALRGPDGTPGGGWEQVIGDAPTPEFAAQAAEEYRRLLDQLGDDQLRSIAVRKMEGFKNEEIAALLDCAVSTVERRLKLIRDIWKEDAKA
jgi:DNA-directed RNA polymerase specialized sigma24 family protein